MATQNNTLKDFLAFRKIILIFSITVSEEMDPRAPECEKQEPRKLLICSQVPSCLQSRVST